MFAFCEEHGIVTERCGKVIVATREAEIPMLGEIERRGRENGLSPIRATKEAILEVEPHVSCVAGLIVRETGIVKFSSVLEALARVVRQRGSEVRLGSRVIGIAHDGGGVVLQTPKGEVRAKNLVNCAGLQCDRIARMAGSDVTLQIIPFRGEYYDLVPERRSLCRNLIYGRSNVYLDIPPDGLRVDAEDEATEEGGRGVRGGDHAAGRNCIQSRGWTPVLLSRLGAGATWYGPR